MRTSIAAVLIAIAAASCSPSVPITEPETASVEPAPIDPGAPAAEQAALSSCALATAEGYCGVAFGAAPDVAHAKFPVKLEIYSSGSPEAQNDINRCYEMFAVEPVQGVSFLVEKNRVGRLDVISEGPKTADGFGVGTPVEEISARFGAAAISAPNKYEPEITELTVAQGAGKLVFEIQDGKVRAWRAGIMPTIDYTEHCG
jgi:hypothetical protein